MAIEAGTSTYYQAKRGIVQDGLVLHLDAGVKESYSGGATWRDLSGNGNNGTLTNGPIFSKNNGGSIFFDQTDDWISMNNLISVSNNYTISYVTLPTDLGSNNHQQWLFDSNQGNAGITLYSYNSGKVGLRDSSNGNRYTWNIDYQTEIYNKLWIMDFVCETTEIKLYLNSVDSGSITPASTAFNIYYIGTNRTGDDQVYGGYIYSVKMYNKALSADEVSRNYNATRHRFGL